MVGYVCKKWQLIKLIDSLMCSQFSHCLLDLSGLRSFIDTVERDSLFKTCLEIVTRNAKITLLSFTHLILLAN